MSLLAKLLHTCAWKPKCICFASLAFASLAFACYDNKLDMYYNYACTEVKAIVLKS